MVSHAVYRISPLWDIETSSTLRLARTTCRRGARRNHLERPETAGCV